MKVVMVLSDGLRDDTAADQMGYLEHLVETRLATRYTVIAEMPTMSRPLYETVHTGVPVTEHGVITTAVVRRSNMPNIFQAAVDNGLTTAAAAYGWYSELYNGVPYDRINHREVDDPTLLIQHGRFYTEDSYPDVELFADAALMIRRHAPDYVLIHPMGMDDQGHKYGANSSQYRNHAVTQDVILGNLIPEWLHLGYCVLVTGDHGMNDDHMHGGSKPAVRNVPFYIITPDGSGAGDTQEQISQLRVAPTVCRLLNVPIPETMKHPPIEV